MLIELRVSCLQAWGEVGTSICINVILCKIGHVRFGVCEAHALFVSLECLCQSYERACAR